MKLLKQKVDFKVMSQSMVLPINKPKGITSHDVINQVRRITGVKRVGHAGTLDPLAQGVLVVAIGREATKKLGAIVLKEKEYLATIGLDKVSVTDDEEGGKTIINVVKVPTVEDIKKTLNKFVGTIDQIPPIYSAVKVKGKEAYKLARKNKPVKLEARKVEIHQIEVIEYLWPRLVIKLVTGKGVYIRSVARDLGTDLGTGGYLMDLVRTRVGQFKLEEAIKIEDLPKYYQD